MTAKLAIKQLLGLSPKIRKQTATATEHHGSAYGGWTIKKDSLNCNSTIISAGIGNDISFDLSLITKYHATIIGIDPTPQVEDWLLRQKIPGSFKFLPIGLSNEDGEAKFYKPINEHHISHSINPVTKMSTDFITVPILSLSAIMLNNMLTHIDLLKMDIEGFEYVVIKDIVNEEILIHQLLIEFHHGLYGFTNRDTVNAISLLNTVGYKIFSISETGREISFINSTTKSFQN
ncbi:MAG: FkbM family methyltransferase [Bacteroidota bacterium]